MRYFLPAVFLFGFLATVPARAAIQTHDELLSRVQAADLLCDLLTWNSDRMAMRVMSMRAYLKEIGKLQEFDDRAQPATAPSPVKVFYSDLMEGSVKYIQAGGEKFADPSLKSLDDAALFRELSALQYYDAQQFSYLKQKRDEAGELAAELKSLGKLDAFEKWARDKNLPGKPAAATQPSSLSPEQIVEMLTKQMQDERDQAWKAAQAKGMSKEDFDKQWMNQAANFKSGLAERVQAMGALSSALDQSVPMEQPVQQIAPPPVNAPAAVPMVPNTWGRILNDPFNTTYQGPGIYNSYDRRLDDEYDQRVNGEYDRRRSLGYDRRENIRTYPRRGV